VITPKNPVSMMKTMGSVYLRITEALVGLLREHPQSKHIPPLWEESISPLFDDSHCNFIEIGGCKSYSILRCELNRRKGTIKENN
jgi:hypothetical protein